MPSAAELAWLIPVLPLMGACLTGLGLISFNRTVNRLRKPVALLLIGANVAGAVLVVTSLHLLYINTRLLPAHVRPPPWRRAALVAMALFYGFFLSLSIATLLRAVDELHADACISDATWAALSQRYKTEQLMDVVFAVGQYNLVSMALNTFGVQLDKGVKGF